MDALDNDLRQARQYAVFLASYMGRISVLLTLLAKQSDVRRRCVR